MIEYKIKLKKPRRTIFHDRWVWAMAWRDTRKNFSRLFLFAASLITGIAAVVSLDALNYSLQQEIQTNAKELLGADLVITADKKIESDVQHYIDSSNFTYASSAEMASMVLFLPSQQSRLIKLVALEGAFPFYGSIETQPADSYERMRTGNYAMLDASLASQYAARAGDSIRLGERVFTIAGVVSEIPGGGGLLSTFTPTVYISMADLDSTKLVQYGSRVNYKRLIKLNDDAEVVATVDEVKPMLKKYGYSYDTVEKQKKSLGNGFNSIYQFFSLLAFLALVLGCIGVASSVHIYAREKREEVAVLRCVGSSGWQAFNIYFIQIFFVGIIGSIIGSLIGIGVQLVIPLFLKGVIPFKVGFIISWHSLLMGLVIGTVVSVLFSMLPLIAIRFVPPLTALRASNEPLQRFSKLQVLMLVLIGIFPFAFATYQTRSWIMGASFTAGLLVALLLLTLVAMALLYIVRKFFPHNASFVWRHALANLFRPNNQTNILMVTIGLGAFIISTLNIVEQSLLSQVEFSGQENQSNTILFDIQPTQKAGVISLMKESGLKANQVVPIVTCRLREVKGKSVSEMQADTTNQKDNWALTREYRVTYRDTLTSSEELLEGEVQHTQSGRDSVGVTISENLLDNLDVKVGDSLVFDVQGLPVKAFISGVRKVDWPKDPPNFIFVFPSGVLEEAPQIYVTTTRIDDQQVANGFQQALILQFPNVSLIDLRLVLSTVNGLFNKLGLIIRFLALFSVITGLVVLAGAVINSKYVRMREYVLLRTVGARTRQITFITLIEYAYLGFFSALTGILLSMASGWLLTTYFFEITFAFDWLEMTYIALGVVVLAMAIGWWNSRDILRTPPLQILRKEN